MANYKIAIGKVLLIEGYILNKKVGYVNDPDDNGGETIAGISHKFWPQWSGWLYVDSYRKQSDFPGCLASDLSFYAKVLAFYEVNFWDKIGGDNINNQDIADLLVASAVNEGISPAVKRAQNIVGQPQTGHITEELVTALNSLS